MSGFSRAPAWIVDERTFAKLKVRFAPAWLAWLPMVWGEYWIIGLATDYSWAVVGDPGRDFLWILARAPYLDDASTAAARAAARDNGFDVARLVPTSQAGVLGHDAQGASTMSSSSHNRVVRWIDGGDGCLWPLGCRGSTSVSVAGTPGGRIRLRRGASS